MTNKKRKLKRGDCVICEGYGELVETTWQEPGFKEYTCPCCAGSGKATKKRVKVFHAECKANDEAEYRMYKELEALDHQ